MWTAALSSVPSLPGVLRLTTRHSARFSSSELNDDNRRFPLAAADFAAVNPNTGTAPVFRTRRAAELTTAIYSRLPVLADRSGGEEIKACPVTHATMFHMSNDSRPFHTREELKEKEITAPANVRTLIAAILPTVGFGNKVPILKPETDDRTEWLLAVNFKATILDFVARQKVQGQTVNLFIVGQLPVVAPDRYEAVRFGLKTTDEVVREAMPELTYTAHDMAPFARDLGYVAESGRVKPPFVWDEERRLHLRAKLDAVYFHLYGVSDRDDVRYVYATFPIVERQERATYGRYRSRDLCLTWLNALLNRPSSSGKNCRSDVG